MMNKKILSLFANEESQRQIGRAVLIYLNQHAKDDNNVYKGLNCARLLHSIQDAIAEEIRNNDPLQDEGLVVCITRMSYYATDQKRPEDAEGVAMGEINGSIQLLNTETIDVVALSPCNQE